MWTDGRSRLAGRSLQHGAGHTIRPEGRASLQAEGKGPSIDVPECGEVVILRDIDGLGDRIIHEGMKIMREYAHWYECKFDNRPDEQRMYFRKRLIP